MIPKTKAEIIEEAFLAAAKRSSKENKTKKFCEEVLKIISDNNLSHLSIDTICYLAMVNAGVKDLNF